MIYTLAAVFPAYNEAGSLPDLLKRAVAAATSSGYSADAVRFVVVNNGSTDKTTSVLEELSKGALGPWFETVTVAQNRGYGDGLMRGLRRVEARWLAYTHADLQCDPADIFRGLKFAEKVGGRVLVKGIRHGRQQSEVVVTRGFEAWVRLRLGLGVAEINAQPKIFSSQLLTVLRNPPSSYGFDLYLLACAVRSGYVIKPFDVTYAARTHGASSWSKSLRGRVRTMWQMGRYVHALASSDGRIRSNKTSHAEGFLARAPDVWAPRGPQV